MHADALHIHDRPHAGPQRHLVGGAIRRQGWVGALGIYDCRIAFGLRLRDSRLWQVASRLQLGRFSISQGFDEWYGIPLSSDPALWELPVGYDASVAPVESIMEGVKGEESHKDRDYTYSPRATIDVEVTDRSVAYIERHANRGKPFFLRALCAAA